MSELKSQRDQTNDTYLVLLRVEQERVHCFISHKITHISQREMKGVQ